MGRPIRAPLFLQGPGLAVEDVLEAIAGESTAPVDGGLLDPGDDVAIGRVVGHPVQLADHEQGLLDGGGLVGVADLDLARVHGDLRGDATSRRSPGYPGLPGRTRINYRTPSTRERASESVHHRRERPVGR